MVPPIISHMPFHFLPQNSLVLPPTAADPPVTRAGLAPSHERCGALHPSIAPGSAEVSLHLIHGTFPSAIPMQC